jgi:DNA repair exonuclease SbcCD ATPase subunit
MKQEALAKQFKQLKMAAGEKIKSLKKENDDLVLKLDQTNELQNRLHIAEGQLKSVDIFKTSFSQLEAEHIDLLEKHESVVKDYEAYKNSTEMKIEQLQFKVEDANSSSLKISELTNKYDEHISNLTEDNRELQQTNDAEVKALLKQISELRENGVNDSKKIENVEMDTLKGEIIDLKQVNSELHNLNSESKVALANLRTDISDLTEELSSTRIELANKEVELASNRETHSENTITVDDTSGHFLAIKAALKLIVTEDDNEEIFNMAISRLDSTIGDHLRGIVKMIKPGDVRSNNFKPHGIFIYNMRNTRE